MANATRPSGDVSELSPAVRFARLIRPFNGRKVQDALYHVQADAASIDARVLRLLVDPPSLPEQWATELDELRNVLVSLADRCGEAYPVLGRMAEEAEPDFQRALSAMLAVMGVVTPDPS